MRKMVVALGLVVGNLAIGARLSLVIVSLGCLSR